VVTAIDANTSSESIASAVVTAQNNDISVNAGSNTISWSPVAGASSYNIYQATPYYSTSGSFTPQVGTPYAYIGTALGTSFSDTNITADYTKTPPLATNPFAVGQITQVTPNNAGSGYSQATVGYTINTSTGSGFVGTPIVLNGGLNGFYISETGQNYAVTDTITITGGTGATATLTIGPETGTYPGAVSYFQQRRVYASTQQNPDTYYMSQPGDYTNMDAAIPSVDTDAIVGTPWAQQVNNIQFMTPMPGGLVLFTGDGAWQLGGYNGGAITPASQDAQPQTRYGCSSTVAPIPINFHILYVRENNGIIYDLVYNFFANIYTGSDLTIYSNHLFDGYEIVNWAYAEKPNKLVWVVRNDGTLLSLTYIAEQEEQGWARHDTNGIFINLCSIEEPPVDAVYVIVQRYIQGKWVYYHERFDDRIWLNPEECFCVDAALVYPLNYPNATLYPAAFEGASNITSSLLTYGGTGYTSPVCEAVDSSGSGSGATFTVTQVGGVITAITPVNIGSGYAEGYTTFVITDPTGTGAVASPVITNNVNFTATASVFNSGMVGDVIRVGNGKATITAYNSGTSVTANITVPITNTVPNDPNFTPIPANYGNWSIGTPITVVTGLNHLNGMEVTGLADGGVITPTVVENGQITLASAASYIVIGLPFLPQLQTLYVDVPQPGNTIQTKRKTIPSVGLRVHDSRGASVGQNQIDASTQPGNVNVPWTGLVQVKERNALIQMGQPIPLDTKDYFINIGGDWNVGGQIAIEQQNPLPLNVDAVCSYIELGDTSG
jgi:hypothetical protein